MNSEDLPHCNLIQPHWADELPQPTAQLMLLSGALAGQTGWLVSMLFSSGLPPTWSSPLHFQASYPHAEWPVPTSEPRADGRHMQTWLPRPIPGPRIHRNPLAEQPPLLIPSARMGSAVPASQTQRKGISTLLRKSRGAASLSLRTPYKEQS